MDKIAVLIPCYNEVKTIEKVVKDYKKVLPDAVVYVLQKNQVNEQLSPQNKAFPRIS